MIDSPASAPARLPQLDALRAIAAVFVLLYHYDYAFGGLAIFQHAQLAVDFLFLLSGLVLSAGVDHRCGNSRSGVRFVAERIGRLWPIMAVGTLMGFTVVWFGHGLTRGTLTTLALALLFIPGRTPREGIFPLNPPQWSLLFELIANAVHALLFWRLRTRMLLILAGVSWLALAAVGYAKGEIAYGPMYPGWQIGVLRIGYAYTLGCAMGRHAPQIARLVRVPWWMPMIALCLLLTRPGREQLLDGVWDAMTLLAFPLVLAASLAEMPPRTLYRTMCISGAASWPLYAFHSPILEAAKAFAGRGIVSPNVAGPVAAALAVALALVVGPSRLAKGIRLPRLKRYPAGARRLANA